MAYVRQHFEELATSEGGCEGGPVGLGALQGGVLRELLASDELHAQSEQQVLEVRAPCSPPLITLWQHVHPRRTTHSAL